jgi:hypothetical protein
MEEWFLSLEQPNESADLYPSRSCRPGRMWSFTTAIRAAMLKAPKWKLSHWGKKPFYCKQTSRMAAQSVLSIGSPRHAKTV